MSRNVEERIVEMQFDNKEFESGVGKTLSLLEKLEEKLKFKGSEAGMAALEAKASTFNMDKMGSAAETVTNKFSALEVAGLAAIGSLASAATQAALKIGKGLVNKYLIKPVSEGFKEYELLQNTIQTIYTNTKSKGTTIDDIEKGLDELNKYADDTIYVMSDMTRAIGQFTNAGVSFGDSKKAVIGFANLAAAVGATNEQLSRVEYQASQAMSAGVFRLLDWNSIQNSPLGGEFFQKALIKQAKEYYSTISDVQLAAIGLEKDQIPGILEGLEKMENGMLSFRQSFSKEKDSGAFYPDWLRADIFTKTLTDFSEDAELLEAATAVRTFTKLRETLEEAAGSGWAQTFKIIIGDFGESKALWTDVAKTLSLVIDGLSDARNSILLFWKEAGGRTQIINGLKYAMEALIRILKPVKEAFDEVLSPFLEKYLMNISIRFEQLTNHMLIGEETANGIKNIFKLLFNVAKLVLTIFGKIADVTSRIVFWVSKAFGDIIQLFGRITGDGEKLKNFWTGIKDFFKKKEIKIPKNAVFEFQDEIDKSVDKVKLLDKAGDILSWFGNKLVNIFNIVKNFFSDQWTKHSGAIISLFEKIKDVGKDLAGKAGNAWANFKNMLENLKNTPEFQKLVSSFKELGSVLADFLKTVGKKALEKFNEFLDGFKDPEKKAERAEKLSKVMSGIADALKTIADWSKKALDGIKGFFDAITKQISSKDAEEIEETAEAVEDVAKAEDKLTDAQKKAGSKKMSGGFVLGAIGPRLDAGEEAVEETEKVTDKWTAAYNKFAEAHGGKGIYKKEDKESIFEKIFSEDNNFLKGVLAGGGILGTIGLVVATWVNVIKLIKSVRTVSEAVIEKVFEPLKGFLESSKDLFGLQGFAKALRARSKAQNFRDIALGIALITGSILAIALLADDTEKLWRAVGIVGIVAGALLAISIILGKLKLSGFEEASKFFISAGISIAIISASIAGIAKMMEDFKNPENVTKAIRSIMIIIGEIGLLMIALSSNFKTYNSYDLGSNYKEILSIAFAVYIITRAMSKLASVQPKNLWSAAAVVSGVMGLLYVIIRAMTHLPEVNGKLFISIGSMLKSMALSLVLIGVAVGILGNIYSADKGESLTAGLISAGAIIVTLLVLAELMSLMPTKYIHTENLKKFATAIILFALAADAIVPAIAVFSIIAHYDWPALLIAVGALAGLFTVISVVMAGASRIEKDGNILIIAGALIMFAFAVRIMAKALYKMGKNIDKVMSGINALAGIMVIFAALSMLTMVPQVTAGILLLVGAFDAFAVGVYILAKATTLFARATFSFASGIKILATISEKDITKITDNLILFINNLYDVWVALAASVVAGAQVFADAWNEIWPILEPVIDSIFGNVTNKFGPWGISIGNGLGDMILNALKRFISYLNEKSEEIINVLIAAFMLLRKYFFQALSKVTDSLIVDLTVRWGKAGYAIGNFLFGWVNDVTEIYNKGIDTLVNFDYDGASKKISNGMDSIANAFSGKNRNYVFDTSTMDVFDFSAMESSALTFSEMLPGEMADQIISSSSVKMPPAGEAMADDNAEGFDNEADIRSAYSSNNLISGLINRLLSPENLGRLFNSGWTEADQVFAGFDARSAIQSPSKEAAWRAEMMAAGFINQMTSSMPEARMTGYKYASYVLTGIKDASAESINYQPDITPVLRSGTLAAQASSLNHLLSANQTMSVATTAKLAAQDAVVMRKAADDMREMSTYDDSNVVGSIGSLSGDINRLGDSIKSMGFYMDGKKVGKIVTPSVNRGLYTDSIRKGRNN